MMKRLRWWWFRQRIQWGIQRRVLWLRLRHPLNRERCLRLRHPLNRERCQLWMSAGRVMCSSECTYRRYHLGMCSWKNEPIRFKE